MLLSILVLWSLRRKNIHPTEEHAPPSQFCFYFYRHQEVRSQWKWFLVGKGLNFRPTETDSQTGYPRSNTQGKNVVYAPSSSLMMDKPPRKETVTFVAAESPPSLGSRPDVVPDQV